MDLSIISGLLLDYINFAHIVLLVAWLLAVYSFGRDLTEEPDPLTKALLGISLATALAHLWSVMALSIWTGPDEHFTRLFWRAAQTTFEAAAWGFLIMVHVRLRVESKQKDT